MARLQEQLDRLRRLNAEIQGVDPELAAEGRAGGLEAMVPTADDEEALGLESIILRRERPVLAIKEDEAQLVFADEIDSQIWRQRLESARPHLDRAIRAVGRIELKGSHLDWVGTGWLVSDKVIVTNRHVANEFALRDGEGFAFRMGDRAPVAAAIDFLQEIDNPATRVFQLVRPLHIEEPPGPDLAFFEVAATTGAAALAQPIELAAQVVATENAATIGYPAYDSRIPEPDLMERIYGSVYNKKRLAPGAVTRVDPKRVLHNCTTLGGNSGSAVIDLNSGKALGLHYSGSFLTTNYAVRADVVAQLLDKLLSGRLRATPGAAPARERQATAIPAGRREPASGGGGGAIASVTIPLTVTVSLGDSAAGADVRPQARFAGASAAAPADEVEGDEAVVEDYRDRAGYRADFLGPDVPLPRVERDSADVLEFDTTGTPETELRYEHFSVVMSRSRRMCFFSAVNIDGGLSKKTKRVGWKWDPRLPRSYQIMKECYGSPPRFSRGHMTRREDPAWGDADTAMRGNADSMHVTNATPQMQAFNSPIWLALEDYALEHARSDRMDISVFTGPYFSDQDPTMYGVRIPRAFWKIIAFIHDETGELCATGYEMNQESTLLPEEEFVFGGFQSPQLGIAAQVRIRDIAQRSGLSFGRLAEHDPLDGDEAPDGLRVGSALAAIEQIRFLA